jgi:hypothetical protein
VSPATMTLRQRIEAGEFQGLELDQAKQLICRMPPADFDFEDAKTAVREWVLLAADAYDPCQGTSFGEYLQRRVRQSSIALVRFARRDCRRMAGQPFCLTRALAEAGLYGRGHYQAERRANLSTIAEIDELLAGIDPRAANWLRLMFRVEDQDGVVRSFSSSAWQSMFAERTGVAAADVNQMTTAIRSRLLQAA